MRFLEGNSLRNLANNEDKDIKEDFTVNVFSKSSKDSIDGDK